MDENRASYRILIGFVWLRTRRRPKLVSEPELRRKRNWFNAGGDAMNRAVLSVCRSSSVRKACLVALGAVVVLGGLAVSRPARSNGLTLTRPPRSTTIALTNYGTRLVVANRETNSVSVIEVARVLGYSRFSSTWIPR